MTFVLATILAHPDDETFGTGGTLIKYASEGVTVHSLCLTEGEQGWPGGDGAPIVPREHVGAARALELAEAGRRMGVASVTCLKYPDGRPLASQKQATKVGLLFTSYVGETFATSKGVVRLDAIPDAHAKTRLYLFAPAAGEQDR